MSINMPKKSKLWRDDAGIALLTTLMLLFLMSSLLVGFSILLVSNQQLAGANNDDVTAFYGAEAGMEKLTSDLGNLFTQTYAPTMSQINALETTPPAIPGLTYTNGSGAPAYLIQPAPGVTLDANGNPQPAIASIKAGPYSGMTAMITGYTLTVTARTNNSREVKLQRTSETVGIPMFQFAMFCEVDCSFHAGQNFNIAGRVHGNKNLFLAAGGGTTLQMQGKVDAYGDIIREYMDNGASVSSNWNGTVSITTNSGGTNYRNLALTEGSITGGENCTGCANTGWPTVSRGSSPADYASNLINGQGSLYPQYSTGADFLNLGIVTMGGGTTQPIDLIRRPIVGETNNVTGERYFAQASLVILLSDNPTDIMSLPCVEPTTQPFDLSQLAQPVSFWPTATTTPTGKLLTQMASYSTPTTPLPLAASGSAGAYNVGTGNANGPASNTDGYWLPGGYPLIKGFIKIQAQTAYGSPCGSWKDVTVEILGLGYAGRNINPVSQSLNGTSMNALWPGVGSARCTSTSSCAQMDPLSYNATPYYATSLSTATTNGIPTPNQVTFPNVTYTYTYPLPNPATSTIVSQSAGVFPTSTSLASGTLYTGQSNACLDPHPNAVIRLERLRDNPSSLYAAYHKPSTTWVNYVTAGTLSAANKPSQAPVAIVCGVDPGTGKLPVIADQTGNTAAWTPEPWDFWPNTLFDTREGELRDNAVTSGANQNLPTLNGTMHYVELDINNLAKWFAGAIGSSGTLTKDTAVAPNDFAVYFSDRRGNYTNAGIGASWPPLSPSGHETGEYGWSDFVNSGDAANGCPNSTLDAGEDLDGNNTQFTYGVNTIDTNWIMGNNPSTMTLATLYTITSGAITGVNTSTNPVPYGEYGFYTTAALTAANSALKANTCSAPTYTNGIWPMTLASVSNSARENPPIFFRRALKVINGKNLTGLGTCPGGGNCGLALATENPVYLQGDYNANSAANGFNDPNVGASIATDALTILSNNWNDANSFSYNEYNIGAPRTPTPTYYRTAIIAGKGVSFPEFGGNADNGTDGGVHNFLRYLEDWGNGPLTVNYMGALVNLSTNRQLNGIFKCCATVYSVPNRAYSFDSSFLNPSSLPPRTPLFHDVDTTGWTRLQLADQ
jgi:hypothetical protein